MFTHGKRVDATFRRHHMGASHTLSTERKNENTRKKVQNVWFYWVALNSRSTQMWNCLSQDMEVVWFNLTWREDGLCLQKQLFFSSSWSHSNILPVKKKWFKTKRGPCVTYSDVLHLFIKLIMGGAHVATRLHGHPLLLAEPLLWSASFWSLWHQDFMLECFQRTLTKCKRSHWQLLWDLRWNVSVLPEIILARFFCHIRGQLNAKVVVHRPVSNNNAKK